MIVATWSIDGCNYEVEVDTPVGQGASGDVFKATDDSGERVAIKRIPRVGAGMSGRELDLSEFLVGLSLPHVVAIHAAGRLDGDGDVAIVMELASGSLRDMLEDGEPLDLGCSVSILIEIATGLEHLGRHGIIHRDLKPENILQTSAGLKISDFGLGRLIDVRNSRTFQARGTAGYMAPEQWLNQPSTIQTDLYALGCVAVELLTGQPPFAESGDAAFRDLHMEAPIPKLAGTLDQRLTLLVRRLLSKKPEQRPADAREVLETLERIRTPATKIATVMAAVNTKAWADAEIASVAQASQAKAVELEAAELVGALNGLEAVAGEFCAGAGPEVECVRLKNLDDGDLPILGIAAPNMRLQLLARRMTDQGPTGLDGHVWLFGSIDVGIEGAPPAPPVMNLAYVCKEQNYTWFTYQLKSHPGPSSEIPERLLLLPNEPPWGVGLSLWGKEISYGRGPGSAGSEVGYELIEQGLSADTLADCIQAALSRYQSGG